MVGAVTGLYNFGVVMRVIRNRAAKAHGKRVAVNKCLTRAARGLALAALQAVAASLVFAQPQKAQSQAQPTPSGRTEILTYDNWTVTCRDPTDSKEKRVCSAELVISREANNQRQAVFSWVIGLSSKDGAPTTVLRFLPGVMIAPGVELKFADKTRKVPITSCEPSYCEATLAMDDAFVKDASAIVQGEAVIQASQGNQVNFTINMKGFAQALAAVRK